MLHLENSFGQSARRNDSPPPKQRSKKRILRKIFARLLGGKPLMLSVLTNILCYASIRTIVQDPFSKVTAHTPCVTQTEFALLPEFFRAAIRPCPFAVGRLAVS